jgi:phosphoglycolate phosphatase
LAPAQHFQAVLFDADGTLLDTLQDLADSMNATLSQFAFPVHATAKYKYFVGDGIENLVRRALPESSAHDPATVSQCVETMRDIYGRNWNKKSRPYPGIPELLDGLANRGIIMTVLSNKPDDFTGKVIRELLPSWHFEIVMGERPPIPRKPDPSSAIEIARRLAIPPENFLYLGDTATDMKTANGAGMYAVGALWGFRTSEELLANGARKLIHTPIELLDIF